MVDPNTRERRQRSLLAEALSAGIAFPISVVVGGLSGRWLDRQFDSEPFGLVVGGLLGFGAALVPVFRLSAAWDRTEPPSPPVASSPEPPPSADAPPEDDEK